MTELLFPDNTVLCNFAAVDRLDLLKSALNGRGRWTEAVAYEASKSARMLPALRGIAKSGWLDGPIEVADDSDVQAVERIRRAVFGGTEVKPLQHLGEAQTCHVILNWGAFAGSWWISDDREALRYARFQGITTRETIDLMSVAVVNGDIAARDGFDLMVKMADSGRHLRLPYSAQDLTR
jgi:predicted nucleic acid-binding protein